MWQQCACAQCRPDAACAHTIGLSRCVGRVQEKANQEAAAAKAAANEDPLAPAPAPQRQEVRLVNGSSNNPPSLLLAAACAASLPGTAQHLVLATMCVRVCLLQDFPALPADGQVMQRNEGRWDFTLQESDDGCVQQAAACPVVHDGDRGGCLRQQTDLVIA